MKGSLVQLAVVFLALAAGLIVAWPGREADVPGPAADRTNAGPEEERLAHHAVATLARHLVAREAAAGKWSLPQAAALFAALNRVPSVVDLSRIRPDDTTEEERVCRQVIGYVDEHAYPESVVRLNAELDALLRSGPICLPNPNALEPIDALMARAKTDLTPAQRRFLFGGRPDDGSGRRP